MRYPRIFQSIAILALLVLPTIARADEIALWNFNDSNDVVDRGAGLLTTTAHIEDITFTTAGAVARNGDPAGMALNIAAGAGFRNNGSTLTLRASTLGFTNVLFDFDGSRTSTGFDAVSLEYSTDGTNFVPINTFDFGGQFHFSVASNDFDNQAMLRFRFTLGVQRMLPGELDLITSRSRVIRSPPPCRNQRRCSYSAQVSPE